MSVFALVAGKGGVGKSTLALAIAWELQRRGESVLVVDTDPQRTLMEAALVAAERKLKPPTTVAMDSNLWQKDQLPRLSRGFSHVVVDTPGRADKIQAAALLVADIALIPVGQFGPDIWALNAAVEVLQKAQSLRPKLKGVLVLSKVKPRTVLGKDLRKALEDTGVPLLKTTATDRVAWGESITAGQGVTEYAPEETAAKEARALVDEVLKLVGKPRGKGRAKS